MNYCADSNMKAAYYLNETSGNALDCTSNANNCTNTSVTRNVTGKYGQAYDFTQINNASLSCGSAASVDDIVSISAGTWLQPDTDGSNDGVACNAASIITKDPSSSGWGFCMQTTAQLRYCQKWTGGRVCWTTTDTPLTFDGTTWQHVAVTYAGTGTGTDPLIYKDGASRTVGNQTPFGTRESDAALTLSIGSEGGNLGEADTRMDEPFLYSGILTSTQINDIKDNGLTPAAAARRAGLAS